MNPHPVAYDSAVHLNCSCCDLLLGLYGWTYKRKVIFCEHPLKKFQWGRWKEREKVIPLCLFSIPLKKSKPKNVKATTSKKPLELASGWYRLMCWNWVRICYCDTFPLARFYNIASSGPPLLPSPTCYNQNDGGHFMHMLLWESVVFSLFIGYKSTQ